MTDREGAAMMPALAAGVREAGFCLGLDPAPANALQIAYEAAGP